VGDSCEPWYGTASVETVDMNSHRPFYGQLSLQFYYCCFEDTSNRLRIPLLNSHECSLSRLANSTHRLPRIWIIHVLPDAAPSINLGDISAAWAHMQDAVASINISVTGLQHAYSSLPHSHRSELLQYPYADVEQVPNFHYPRYVSRSSSCYQISKKT
jgi:hypothetical protein